MKKIFVLGAIVTLFAVSASAQVGSDGIERQRIERGFNSGALTRPEKARLHRDESRFRNEKRRALRNGRLDRHERKRLARMKRHDRREMFRFRHNGRRRSL